MESNIKKNVILYDWVSFTSKKHSPDQLIAALGLSHVPWTETKGARGYRDRKYFSCISIHYNGRDDMGVWVEMSGQGCRTFESLSQVGWTNLFKFIHDNDLNMTRLDVAYDDHTGILDIQQIAEDTRKKRFVSRSDKYQVHYSGDTSSDEEGLTIDIGSPQSKVVIRIYDKAVERGHSNKDMHWIRCEMQLRDDRALQFTRIPKPIGEAFCGVLLNYLRYVVPSGDSNKSRWQMTDYWYALVGDAEKISIYTAPGMEYNEERCKHYVVNQAGNAIDACIQMYGSDEFLDMIEKRQTMPNPKYAELIRRHRVEVLAYRIRTWFDTSDEPPMDFPGAPATVPAGIHNENPISPYW